MGFDQCFKCKGGKHRKLVMPETMVFPEKAQEKYLDLDIDKREQAHLLREFERKQNEKKRLILSRSNPDTNPQDLAVTSSDNKQNLKHVVTFVEPLCSNVAPVHQANVQYEPGMSFMVVCVSFICVHMCMYVIYMH